MTNEKAKKMLKAKLECLKRETSGTDIDCNYRNCDECNLCYDQGNMGEQKEALEMAIKALEQTRWIPCSERLPREDEEYHTFLVTDSKGRIELSKFYLSISDKKPYWGIMMNVVAWMPLPEPYKAESEEQ